MGLQAVIFDLDGTLADTIADIAASMNYSLQKQGLPTHPDDAYRELVGEGVGRLVERALPPGAENLYDAVMNGLREHYVEHMLDKTRPYPGVSELLDQLTTARVPLAILSNKPEEPTREMVETMFGRWSFVTVVGEAPGIPLKPDPTAVLAIAERMDVPPAACLYLGDTGVDMQTAAAAGMYAVGAAWGFRGREELLENGAQTVIDHPSELLAFLDSAGPS